MVHLRTEFAYLGSAFGIGCAFLHTGIGVSFLATCKQGKELCRTGCLKSGSNIELHTVVAELLTELRSDKIDLLLVGVETTDMDVITVSYLSSYHS